MKIIKLVVMSSLFLFAQGALAGKLTAEDGWVRAVPPVSKNTAAYLTLKNGSKKKDSILHMSSAAAKHTELHTIVVEPSGAKKMQKLAHVTIESGSELALKPGGYHIMLIDLVKPLKDGDKVTIDMIFNHAGKISVTLPVKISGGESGGNEGHHHHHH